MRDVVILFIHLIVTVVRLARPGGSDTRSLSDFARTRILEAWSKSTLANLETCWEEPHPVIVKLLLRFGPSKSEGRPCAAQVPS